MNYHIVLNGRLYKVTLDIKKENLVSKEVGVAPKLYIPFVILGKVSHIPNDFREMIQYFCAKNQPIFPISETEGPMAEEFIKLGWKPDEEVYLKRKEKVEKIVQTLSISDEYHTRINGYFIHTITPEYLILQKNKLIPVFFGTKDEDILEIKQDSIKGSFLEGPIKYERRSKENGITLIAY